MATESISPASGSRAPAPVPQHAPRAAASTEPAAAPVDGNEASAPRAAAYSRDEVREAVKKIENAIKPGAQDLRFSIDEDTGGTVIKLIDTQTQTVLRQIPTVEALEISKALDKLQGLLVREKA